MRQSAIDATLAAAFGAAKPQPRPTLLADDYLRAAEVLQIKDGDTIKVRIDLGYGCDFKTAIRFRRVNAAEAKTVDGPKWTKFTTEWLAKITPGSLHVLTYRYQVDRYFRYLADVYGYVGNQIVCLNDDLLAAGCPAAPKNW